MTLKGDKMGTLQISFRGNSDEYGYDINGKSIIFYDKKNKYLIIGEYESLNIKTDAQEYNTIAGECGISVSSVRDINVTILNPKFFKYDFGDTINYINRFEVYWNMRETVIWDTELHRRVDDNNIPKYIEKIEKEREEKERKKIYQEEKKKEEEDELEDYRYEKDEWW